MKNLYEIKETWKTYAFSKWPFIAIYLSQRMC